MSDAQRWSLLRLAFLIAVAVSAWWSWRDEGTELTEAIRQVSAGRVAVAEGLTVAGLVITGFVWRTALRSFEVNAPTAQVVLPFFVAQLGKYIPGSVWAFAAQGAIGIRRGVARRTSATAAALFLGLHVASGLLLVGSIGWWSALPVWLVWLSLVLGVVGLSPQLYRALGRRLATVSCDWTVGRSGLGTAFMLPAWCCYAMGLVVLVPQPDISATLTVGASYAVAHAAGVAIPLAPAGLGAREGAFVLLVAPVIGLGDASVVALLARGIHTVADFLVAGVCWLVLRLFDV